MDVFQCLFLRVLGDGSAQFVNLQLARFFGRASVHFASTRVHIQDFPRLQIMNEDCFFSSVEDFAVVHLGSLQRLFDLLSLQKLADLICDRCRGIQQILIGRQNSTAEKAHHSEYPVPSPQRKSECRTKPGFAGQFQSARVQFVTDVRYPNGFLFPPNTTWQTLIKSEGH